jgi:hypothetical protein
MTRIQREQRGDFDSVSSRAESVAPKAKEEDPRSFRSIRSIRAEAVSRRSIGLRSNPCYPSPFALLAEARRK